MKEKIQHRDHSAQMGEGLHGAAHPRGMHAAVGAQWRQGAWLFGFLALAAGGSGAATEADAIRLPSGETAHLQEVIEETSGDVAVARYRFIAPWITQASDYTVVAEDMQSLCQDFVLPRLADLDSEPTRIVISLAAEKAEFAVANPDITQFFESYTLSGDLCIWEAF